MRRRLRPVASPGASRCSSEKMSRAYLRPYCSTAGGLRLKHSLNRQNNHTKIHKRKSKTDSWQLSFCFLFVSLFLFAYSLSFVCVCVLNIFVIMLFVLLNVTPAALNTARKGQGLQFLHTNICFLGGRKKSTKGFVDAAQ